MANLTPSAKDQDVGRIVKMLLTYNGVKRDGLAEALKLDSAGMSRALAGKRKWTVHDLDTMAGFFDVPVSYFFEPPEQLFRSRCSSPRLVERALSAAGIATNS